jgi:malonyl-CoA/methylmalonyl-CoA synthetase
MTDTGMNISNPLRGERRPGTVGIPLPGVEARISDPETGEPLPAGEVGEIQLRGPNVFSGYWRKPRETEESFTPDGWLHTGDLGTCDGDGYYSIVGRAKELIISGGMNVYPKEVERVIDGHPAVAESAVVGVPDPDLGEKVVACVVLNPGAHAENDDIIAFCGDSLAGYKKPKEIVFVEELPRNAMGKVLKGELRNSMGETLL